MLPEHQQLKAADFSFEGTVWFGPESYLFHLEEALKIYRHFQIEALKTFSRN